MKIKSVAKGFTLIELLVVVLIIGVLTAVALPGYRKSVEKSRVADALTTMQAVAKSEHAWYLEHSNYTDDFANLDIELTGTINEGALETDFYTYELLDTGILAERNNHEYLIYKDYETKQIMCTPGNHYICENLGAFTKEPCEKADMAWSDKNATCYVDDETKCLAVNLGVSNIWHNETETEPAYCGYKNTQGQTLEDGTKCVGTGVYNGSCKNSVIKKGGVCEGKEGEGVETCYLSHVYDGGVCNGNVKYGCLQAKVHSGGVCKSDALYGCLQARIEEGGECLALNNLSYENCIQVTYEGSGATSGCCRGNCPSNAPRCECPNHERKDSNGNCITE